MISSTNETFSRSRPNNRSNIRFRHCIRPPDYYSTKWPILWMLCYSSILFISIEPIDGSITQEGMMLFFFVTIFSIQNSISFIINKMF